ncbi:hypothetical protein [Pleionea sp. CnH1-48]|uniref:hypothetical protein n=1 Tax=Pleionea sp. CnH1-48 TaxID=2954494 RepID=UPI0020984AEE|nr:hypothetical protein [Pleionea sp. CnH1-48]MCO7224807.1 hypothetical protein [Pleionea sp. CnH1-48]
MKKIYLDRKFLFGLYCYVIQVQLSIDRALHADWEYWVLYFSKRTSVEDVLKSLERKSTGELDPASLGSLNTAVHSSLFCRLMAIFNKDFLTSRELEAIYSRLYKFNELLKMPEVQDENTLVKLRMDLCFIGKAIQYHIRSTDLKKIKYVEHFNQNEMFDERNVSIEKVVGGEWLE